MNRSAVSQRLPSRAPLWLAVITLLLAAAGIAVATYLTIAHFDESVVLSCPDNGAINCAKVTTSEQSHFLGMPVAVLGLAYFVFIPVLLIPAAWRSTSPLIRRARLLASGGGLVFVLWLVYAEAFKIKAICLYCTAVHVLTFLLFVAVLIGTVITAPYDDTDDDLDGDLDDDLGDEDESDDENAEPAPTR
jgi:uncharacterized membrane protein